MRLLRNNLGQRGSDGKSQISCISQEQVALFDTVLSLEVCTGSKLKPEPGPYPRSSDPTRPDPTRAAQLNLEPEPDPKSPPPHNE